MYFLIPFYLKGKKKIQLSHFIFTQEKERDKLISQIYLLVVLAMEMAVTGDGPGWEVRIINGSLGGLTQFHLCFYPS